MHAVVCLLALSAVQHEKYLAWTPQPADISSLPASTGERLSAADLAALASGKPTLPYGDLTVGVRATDKGLWVGSQHGLMYLAPARRAGRYFILALGCRTVTCRILPSASRAK